MTGHRGTQPDDARLFAPDRVPILRRAVTDLAWLLTRGYGADSALRLVGDHFQLTSRQRLAVGRSSCSDAARDGRARRRLALAACRFQPLVIDGYNLLITLESALASGCLLRGRDGAIRDLASVHGSWRRVAETERAIRVVADALRSAEAGPVTWFLDAPVSNSGRLKTLLQTTGTALDLPWTVELTMNADRAILATGLPVVSSDSWILDEAAAWVNLAAEVLPGITPPPPVLDLQAPDPPPDRTAPLPSPEQGVRATSRGGSGALPAPRRATPSRGAERLFRAAIRGDTGVGQARSRSALWRGGRRASRAAGRVGPGGGGPTPGRSAPPRGAQPPSRGTSRGRRRERPTSGRSGLPPMRPRR
ncbi:MAG: DUF434 domain-containing protein [Candidatus Riflebacteria bacterium]|nr:DUF434 domain-containing protein [Candidatus Riflebacteria bacterium]